MKPHENDEEEDEDSGCLPNAAVPETIEELYSKIPNEFMKADDHPLFDMIEKAESSTNDLADALDSLNVLLKKCNESVNIFPQASIDLAGIEPLRARLDAVYQNHDVNETNDL